MNRTARASTTIRFLQLLSAGLLFSFGSARANSYAAGPPLEKIPAPEEVFAFSSDPPCPTPRQEPPLEPSRALPEAEFHRFLKEGVIEPDPHAITVVSDGSWCLGYFFTKDGTYYRWTLWSRHLLSIGTSNRGCLIRLKDPGVQSVPAPLDADVLQPLAKPPGEKDVFAFVSDLYPATGGAVPLSKENLLHFLRDGKHTVFKDRSEIFDIALRQRLTLPPELTKQISKYYTPVNGTFSFYENDLHCEGALVTKDRRIYFWELLGDTALELTSPTGEKCVFILPESDPIKPPTAP
jgi:hypothetical protein